MTSEGDMKKRRRYYTPEEMALHNCAEDCWVSVFGKVYDLTEFIAANRGPLAQPIILMSGKDVSHWFDEKTKYVRMHIDPETNLRLPYLPMGRFLHVPPAFPSSAWRTDFGTPWWQDADLCIGALSQKTRVVRIINALTRQADELIVPTEETIDEIQDRCLSYNAHAASYTWKSLREGKFEVLDMAKTLAENGVIDELDNFKMLDPKPEGFPPEETDLTESEKRIVEEANRYDESDIHAEYIPELVLYYNDDLTVA
uniref:Cytochrome b5 domain-containing protein 1 n=1 Tax=Phaeomonas parva TaxID=124430 RepID=A0A7S1TZ39_9STRA|mmetsp:Transcript_2362/g.7031  ORF Transcript_2362/g.7031 Transcript_2362/m.7031 type:complete len:256 (+) Transcript_2362:161-928(+)